jgi:hypothetical protein
LASLAAYLASHGIAYALTANGQELVIGFEEEGSPHYFSFVATPGWLHFFLVLSGALPPSETDEDIGRLLAGLTVQYPLPAEWQGLALYETNDRRELGLYVRLPMPQRLQVDLLEDALLLCERLLDAVSADDSAA